MKVFAVAGALCALLAGCDQMPEPKPSWHRALLTEKVGDTGLFVENGAIYVEVGENAKEQFVTVKNLTQDKVALSVEIDIQYLDKDKGLLATSRRYFSPFKSGQKKRYLLDRVEGRKSFKISNVKVIWNVTEP